MYLVLTPSQLNGPHSFGGYFMDDPGAVRQLLQENPGRIVYSLDTLTRIADIHAEYKEELENGEIR